MSDSWLVLLCFVVGSGAAAMTAGLAVGWTIPAFAESSLGLTGSLTFAGDQDVLIVDRNGSARSDDVSAAIGPVAGVTRTFCSSYLGLQLDGIYLKTSARAAVPGSLKKVAVSTCAHISGGGFIAGIRSTADGITGPLNVFAHHVARRIAVTVGYDR